MNGLFLYKCQSGLPGIMLKVGSRDRGRRMYLSDDEALQLAYRLMSLARGGATSGVEEFRHD